MFQEWDISDNLELSRSEVQDGLARLGINLSRTMLTHLFDAMADGFHLQYDEFKTWLETTSRWELEEERRSVAAVALGKWARGFLTRRNAVCIETKPPQPPEAAPEGGPIDI